MTAFVIEYNRRTGASQVTEFGAGRNRDALNYRFELERSRSDADIEIVSLVSDSLATVRRTHARYFRHEPVLRSA